MQHMQKLTTTRRESSHLSTTTPTGCGLYCSRMRKVLRAAPSGAALLTTKPSSRAAMRARGLPMRPSRCWLHPDYAFHRNGNLSRVGLEPDGDCTPPHTHNRLPGNSHQAFEDLGQWQIHEGTFLCWPTFGAVCILAAKTPTEATLPGSYAARDEVSHGSTKPFNTHRHTNTTRHD